MFSQGWFGGDSGIEEQGHASPRGLPLIVVLVAGQMLDSPSIKTDQRVGRGTTGTEDACVVGCDNR